MKVLGSGSDWQQRIAGPPGTDLRPGAGVRAWMPGQEGPRRRRAAGPNRHAEDGRRANDRAGAETLVHRGPHGAAELRRRGPGRNREVGSRRFGPGRILPPPRTCPCGKGGGAAWRRRV